MPRFVILTHDWPFLHWDLMLENDGKLLTWRLLEEPQLGASLRIEKSADHRLKYLDFAGSVSGGRGTVVQWDCGLIQNLSLSGSQTTAEIQSERFEGLVIVTLGERDALFTAAGKAVDILRNS